MLILITPKSVTISHYTIGFATFLESFIPKTGNAYL